MRGKPTLLAAALHAAATPAAASWLSGIADALGMAPAPAADGSAPAPSAMDSLPQQANAAEEVAAVEGVAAVLPAKPVSAPAEEKVQPPLDAQVSEKAQEGPDRALSNQPLEKDQAEAEKKRVAAERQRAAVHLAGLHSNKLLSDLEAIAFDPEVPRFTPHPEQPDPARNYLDEEAEVARLDAEKRGLRMSVLAVGKKLKPRLTYPHTSRKHGPLAYPCKRIRGGIRVGNVTTLHKQPAQCRQQSHRPRSDGLEQASAQTFFFWNKNINETFDMNTPILEQPALLERANERGMLDDETGNLTAEGREEEDDNNFFSEQFVVGAENSTFIHFCRRINYVKLKNLPEKQQKLDAWGEEIVPLFNSSNFSKVPVVDELPADFYNPPVNFNFYQHPQDLFIGGEFLAKLRSQISMGYSMASHRLHDASSGDFFLHFIEGVLKFTQWYRLREAGDYFHTVDLFSGYARDFVVHFVEHKNLHFYASLDAGRHLKWLRHTEDCPFGEVEGFCADDAKKAVYEEKKKKAQEVQLAFAGDVLESKGQLEQNFGGCNMYAEVASRSFLGIISILRLLQFSNEEASVKHLRADQDFRRLIELFFVEALRERCGFALNSARAWGDEKSVHGGVLSSLLGKDACAEARAVSASVTKGGRAKKSVDYFSEGERRMSIAFVSEKLRKVPDRELQDAFVKALVGPYNAHEEPTFGELETEEEKNKVRMRLKERHLTPGAKNKTMEHYARLRRGVKQDIRDLRKTQLHPPQPGAEFTPRFGAGGK